MNTPEGTPLAESTAKELDALRTIIMAIGYFDRETRTRMLQYLWSRFVEDTK